MKLKPIPLQRELGLSKPFPVAALGPVLEPAVLKVHQAIQSPLAMCAQSALAVTTFAVQRLANVSIDGRKVPLSEYFATMGESGERKTATDRALSSEVERYQDDLTAKYSEEEEAFKNQFAIHQCRRENTLRKMKDHSPSKDGTGNIELPNEPQAPISPIVLTTDVTVEGLAKNFINGQPGMALFSSEGSSFVSGYGMKKEEQLKTAAMLSELWDGARICRIRAGEMVPKVVKDRRFSMHIMMQPKVLALLTSNEALSDQGFMSRLLVAAPESTSGTRFYTGIDLSQDRDMAHFNQKISHLLRRPLPLTPGMLNELSPRLLSLDTEGKQLYVGFHDNIERNLGKGGIYVPIRGFANKAAEHALRLAGVLTVVEDPDAEYIVGSTMTRGIELTLYYLGEALRLFNSAKADWELTSAEKLLKWIQEEAKRYVSLPDVYQYGPNFIRTAKLARSLMLILEEHGWVKFVGPTPESGSSHREVWEVASATNLIQCPG